MPPSVSIPRESGVTSSNKTSFTSPASIPACIAAPIATHSIGSMPRSTFLPATSSTNFWTAGILVGPPTSIILSRSSFVNLASSMACSIDFLQRSMIGFTNDSSFALVSLCWKCFGPSFVAERKGRFMSVSSVVDSSIFAFSAASSSLCIAAESFVISMPSAFLNSSTRKSVNASSISVPPSCVSPWVDLTSKTPSPDICIIVTSNVPPPKSNTRTVNSLPVLSSPYANAAAVGSLTSLITSRPAIAPASLVACL